MTETIDQATNALEAPPATRDAAEEQLDQLRFLHRVARLATTEETWE